tara:strand:- start:997 stop:1275 length:279 start_codon:yes stop_codon:yes gene_type:complete
MSCGYNSDNFEDFEEENDNIDDYDLIYDKDDKETDYEEQPPSVYKEKNSEIKEEDSEETSAMWFMEERFKKKEEDEIQEKKNTFCMEEEGYL